MRSGIIELEQLEFYAFHGCYALEQQVGNHFEVSLRLEGDLEGAVEQDQVAHTINYLTVYEVVAREMQIPSHTLEHVGGRILATLYATFPQLTSATVKVSKCYPPLGGKIGRVSVTLSQPPSNQAGESNC